MTANSTLFISWNFRNYKLSNFSVPYLKQQRMIYKLWRKETVKKIINPNTTELSESYFIEEISRWIKLMKKKEQLYFKIIDQSIKPLAEESIFFVKQYEQFAEDQKQLLNTIQLFKNQAFYNSKTYLFTVFLRISEVFDASKLKLRMLFRKDLQKNLDQAKNIIIDLYNNLSYFKKYDVLEIIQYFQKNQNQRIIQCLPKRKLLPIGPIVKSKQILENENKEHNETKFRRTISVEIKKSLKQSSTIDLLSKKLVKKQLATQKRSEQKKKKKSKEIWKLYQILEVKAFPIENSLAFRIQLEQNMLERNKCILDECRQWGKKHAKYKETSRLKAIYAK